MEYRFPAELQTYVDQMIASGAFSDVHELVLDAVHRQREGYLNWKRKHDELKGEIQIGIDDLDNGRSAELDLDAILQEALAELKSDTRAG